MSSSLAPLPSFQRGPLTPSFLIPSPLTGTGAVYCQIFDSIYQDLPMSKVKFDAKPHEYLTNYKILQVSFKKHGLDKVSSLLAVDGTSRDLELC